MEVLPTSEKQSNQSEASKPSLKIVEVADRLYNDDDLPVQEEGVITHYKIATPLTPEGIHKFKLTKQIGPYHYIFSFAESYSPNAYTINFKTEEYEYARIDLTDEEREELWTTIFDLIESIDASSDIPLEIIKVSPADASYTSEQIENCMATILEHDPNLSREELLRDYKGFRIFDLYRKKFNKDFLAKHYNSTSRASARARLFQSIIKKHISGWEMADNGGVDFVLKKRK